MQTTNIVDENIKRIGELFPNCLTERLNDEGKPEVAIDFDQLRQELSKDIVEGPEERYQFTWPDKRNAIRLANAPTTDTLRPCREESVDFDNTQNLYIEGDNLQVLKLLRENYLGKVKMIYIDPPYNTGNDFVYNDDFSQSAGVYMHNSGQEDEEGNRLYVLDAKYYKFGMTGSASDLPSSGSICKQIAYAEYVETHWKKFLGVDSIATPSASPQNDTLPKPIYNAFLLPYCFDADNSQLPPDDGFETRPCKMRFIGLCHGNWKNLDARPGEGDYRPYHRIAGILLDVRSVMENYGASGKAQKTLSTCILRENSNHSE